MKIRVLIFFSVLKLYSAQAQDTIVKRTGDTLITKLVEVGPLDLKYKLFNYQDGPLFTLPREEIRFVVYGNGKKEMLDNFVAPLKSNPVDLSLQTAGKFYYFKEKKIGETDMLAIAGKLKDRKINHMIKKVENLKFIQQATTIGSIGLFTSGFYIYETNRPVRTRRGAPAANNTARAQAQKNGTILMLSGLACGVVSISFMLDRRRHDRVVVNAYNLFIGHP